MTMDLVLPSGRTLGEHDLDLIAKMHAAGTVRWGNKPFSLKSGGTSHVYFMGREDLTLNLKLLTQLVHSALDHLWLATEVDMDKPCCLIGVPSAGTAIASWMAAVHHLEYQHDDMSFLVMRQVLKKHGNNQTWIDGRPPEDALTVMVENVRTTGASEEEALGRMREDGIDTAKIVRLAMVDRKLRPETDTLKSVYYMADIVAGLGHLGLWTEEQVATSLPEFLQAA